MLSLRETIKNSQQRRRAIGHFNVADFSMLVGIARVAKKMDVPVIIGVSEGERDFWGLTQIRALVDAFKKDGVEMFLNADHTHSIERVEQAVDAGFDAILFDAGKEDLAQNIAHTRRAVEIVRQYNYKNGTDILVEGELGYIGGGSVVLEQIPQDADVKKDDLTSVADAKKFIEETGVDMIAPAIGNLHGMFAHNKNPDIDIVRVEEIVKETHVPVVLHGGSGIAPSQIQEAVRAGVSIVHISTELRVAWKQGLDMAILSKPKEIVPYKLLPEIIHNVERVVEEKLKLLNNF